MKNNTLNLTWAALIAALYVVLTFIANAAGLASGAIQIRLSEALTIMPLFTWAAVPGLTIGCALANMMTGCALWDIVFGSLATFLGAAGTYYIGRKVPVLGPVFPIVSNALIVPLVLQKVYGLQEGYLYLLVTVGIGEIISCGVLGWLLYKGLKKRKIDWL
ncbi:MAG: QueT transporter family protein [Firmicutes bacterium]|nr:QueT transporter family protein [Bacillota bacterium]MBR6584197.1 QueT transporter family protein [Bacillota bacterium]